MSKTLYIKSESRLLNPMLDAQLEAEDYVSDAESARSEWGGEFRSDLSQFLPDDLIDSAIIRERKSIQRDLQYQYAAFIDSSGGAHDRFVLAISHRDESSRLLLDKLEVVNPPFQFLEVVERFAMVMGAYGTNIATGDAYLGADKGGVLPQLFSKHGIGYRKSDLSKSQIFAQVLPLFSSGLIELLDVASLHSELRALERRPRSGELGDKIEVPRNGFDDQANAACGSLLLASKQLGGSNEYANNVTHAITAYDPLTRDSQTDVRRRPRHLPPGMFGGQYDEDFSQAVRSYDPLDR